MRRQQTVGEMIASHHWRDASDRARKADKQFMDTELGRAFHAMLNAHARMWQLDGQEHVSDRAMKVATERDDEAQRTFLTLMSRAIDDARRASKSEIN